MVVPHCRSLRAYDIDTYVHIYYIHILYDL